MTQEVSVANAPSISPVLNELRQLGPVGQALQVIHDRMFKIEYCTFGLSQEHTTDDYANKIIPIIARLNSLNRFKVRQEREYTDMTESVNAIREEVKNTVELTRNSKAAKLEPRIKHIEEAVEALEQYKSPQKPETTTNISQKVQDQMNKFQQHVLQQLDQQSKLLEKQQTASAAAAAEKDTKLRIFIEERAQVLARDEVKKNNEKLREELSAKIQKEMQQRLDELDSKLKQVNDRHAKMFTKVAALERKSTTSQDQRKTIQLPNQRKGDDRTDELTSILSKKPLAKISPVSGDGTAKIADSSVASKITSLESTTNGLESRISKIEKQLEASKESSPSIQPLTTPERIATTDSPPGKMSGSPVDMYAVVHNKIIHRVNDELDAKLKRPLEAVHTKIAYLTNMNNALFETIGIERPIRRSKDSGGPPEKRAKIDGIEAGPSLSLQLPELPTQEDPNVAIDLTDDQDIFAIPIKRAESATTYQKEYTVTELGKETPLNVVLLNIWDAVCLVAERTEQMHHQIDKVSTSSKADSKKALNGLKQLVEGFNQFREAFNQQTTTIEAVRDELAATSTVQIAEVNGDTKLVTMKTILLNELTSITKYVCTEIMKLSRNKEARTSSRAPTAPVVRPPYQPHGQANTTRGRQIHTAPPLYQGQPQQYMPGQASYPPAHQYAGQNLGPHNYPVNQGPGPQ